MIERSVILAKFQNLDKCLSRIRQKVKADASNLSELDIQDIFVLNLQRAVQLAIDVAAHIIKEKGFALPNTLKEYFSILAAEGILSTDLASRLERMVGFRNIAVHDYEVLDPEILKNIFKKHLSDIEDFQRAILRVLNSPIST